MYLYSSVIIFMVIIMKKLEIRDLHVNAGEKEILKGIDLDINTGEIHAIMGPNGNGKSTLLQTIMGHPAYTVTKGSILFDGEDEEVKKKTDNQQDEERASGGDQE